MTKYDVKCWITVEAKDELDAETKAAAILDSLPEQYVGQTSIEGEGAVYEVDDILEEP